MTMSKVHVYQKENLWIQFLCYYYYYYYYYFCFEGDSISLLYPVILVTINNHKLISAMTLTVEKLTVIKGKLILHTSQEAYVPQEHQKK